MVLFWNGIRLHVRKDLAVWIPASHHEQIIRELQPNVLRPGCLNHSHCSHINWSPVCCINHINHCLPTTPSMCLCPVKNCPLSNQRLLMDNQWKAQEIKPDQVNELTASQEMKTDLSSSDSSENEEEVTNEKLNSTPELVSCSVNTEISYLNKSHSEPQNRPAWRYWRRGSPEPHHKKPGNCLPDHRPSLVSLIEPKIHKSMRTSHTSNSFLLRSLSFNVKIVSMLFVCNYIFKYN